MQSSYGQMQEDLKLHIELILVIFDYDLTLTEFHTKGIKKRHRFEKPSFATNLRFLDKMTHLMRVLKHNPNMIIGVASFNTWDVRVISSMHEFGLEPDDYLLELDSKGEYLADAKIHYKNSMIKTLIERFYASKSIEQYRIVKIILIDDDPDNINHFENSILEYINPKHRVHIESIHGLIAHNPAYDITDKKCQQLEGHPESSHFIDALYRLCELLKINCSEIGLIEPLDDVNSSDGYDSYHGSGSDDGGSPAHCATDKAEQEAPDDEEAAGVDNGFSQ